MCRIFEEDMCSIKRLPSGIYGEFGNIMQVWELQSETWQQINELKECGLNKNHAKCQLPGSNSF